MRSAWLLMIVALPGCYSPERASRQELVVPPPKNWLAGATDEGVVQGDWWLRFGSKNLNRAVKDTLAHNPDLRAAEARLAQAAALARIAGADLYPHISAGFDASRQRQNFVGLPIPGSSGVLSRTFNNFGVSLGTSWELDIWGRIRSGKQAALEDVEASAENLRALRQSLAAQAAKAWLAMVEAQEQLDLAQRTAGNFRRTRERVRERFERGVRSALDLRLARANVASAKAQIYLWRQQLGRTRRQLEILRGRYPSGSSPVSRKLPQLPGMPPVGLPTEMLRRRPDLLALEHQMASQGYRVDEARAALYPRISLTSSMGTASDELNDLLDSDFFVWNVLGNLFQPVFEGGRLIAEVDLNVAAEYEAMSNYVSAVLVAYSEVETVLATEGFLAERVAALKQSTTETVAAATLSEDRYRRGLEDFITVLESQRAALNSESALISSQREQLEQRVDLHLALGGGFERTTKSGLPKADKEGTQ